MCGRAEESSLMAINLIEPEEIAAFKASEDIKVKRAKLR